MKVCPSCRRTFSGDYRFCPYDGLTLRAEAPPDEAQAEPAADIILAREEQRADELLADELLEQPYPPLAEPAAAPRARLRRAATLVLLLVALSCVSFSLALIYYHLRPKYGRLQIKSNPAGAEVYIDGQYVGVTPLVRDRLAAGRHSIRATKDGYMEVLREVELRPDGNELLFLNLPLQLASRLAPEQQAEVARLTRMAETAVSENILIPPPDDYNALYFLNKILEIDPTDQYALETKRKIAHSFLAAAATASARGDLVEAERNYKRAAMVLPEDSEVQRKLAELSQKIEAMRKERLRQLDELMGRVELALKNGQVSPVGWPQNSAVEALEAMLKLDARNTYARETMARAKELWRAQIEQKTAAGDWLGAEAEYLAFLQRFPQDQAAQSRLELVREKLEETRRIEDERRREAERLSALRARAESLRQQGIAAYRSGNSARAIQLLKEALEIEPENSEAYFYLGAAQLERKQYDEAIASFEHCGRLNPTHALAHLNLGILYDVHKQDFAQSESHLVRARELGGADGYSVDRINKMIEQVRLKAQLSERERRPFAVEHKHILSSCKGGLQISSDGIRFQARQSNHSFQQPLDAASISLKEDQLEIRLRDNRRFNFKLLNGEDAKILRLILRRYKQEKGEARS